jgi:hypothetical protein
VNGTVPEPGSKDRLTFRLANRDREKTYAVVLKVNGKSTLFYETHEPLRCRKWILGPGEELEVKGFQTGPDTYEAFEVLSPQESAKHALYYGSAVGTFSLAVLRERTSSDNIITAVSDVTRQARDLVTSHRPEAAVQKGMLDEADVKPGDLAALQAQLMRRRTEDGRGAKGIVVGGQRDRLEVQYVGFVPDPEWLRSVEVRYWKPRTVRISE